MEIFLERIRKFWNEWELQVMVLISLSLQIILIVLSNRRKYTTRNWLRVVVWLTYLSADWVATVALGILCRSQGDSQSIINGAAASPDSVIMAFWAPFLLLHLGGPDTMTAYSLEDNELWLRHFLGLFVQVGVAFYILFRSWMTGTHQLTFVALPMFVGGIIKYGERTWVLRSASSQHFRDSLLPPPNPGLDYVKAIKEYGDEAIKEYGDDDVESQPNFESIVDDEMSKVGMDNIFPNARIFHEAYSFFEIFRRLYAELIFRLPEIKHSYEVFSKKSSNDAFKAIELELGFMFDVLHTKASLVYSQAGCFLRPISFISTVSAFAGFLIVDKHGYSTINVIISYVLLVGAIVIEMYAVIILLFSDWTMLWLKKQNNPLLNGINKAIFSVVKKNKRWSHSMSQYNLLSFSLKGKRRKPTNCPGIQKYILSFYEKFDKYQQIDRKDVSSELIEYAFQHILDKARSLVLGGSYEGVVKICGWRGEGVLEKFGTAINDNLHWSIEVEFDESILLWHIATDLYYYSEHEDADNTQFQKSKLVSKRISKLLSDYMLYLLVIRPFMLPKGIGKLRFQDTVAEAERFFKDSGLKSIEVAQKMLLGVDCRYTESEVKGDVSKSVLFDGCRLAKSLKSLPWQNERIWEMISHVWVEMLCYAANQCRWNQHAQQLSRGGELLTHISLLMTHLGLTEQLKVIRIREDREDDIEDDIEDVIYGFTLNSKKRDKRRRAHAQAIRAAHLFKQAGEAATKMRSRPQPRHDDVRD